LDELPRNWVVMDASVANSDAQRIGMRAERHIPEREDDTVVRVAELQVGGVMKPVKLRCDREVVHERGNAASDVRMTHKACDGLCNKLPEDQLGGCAEYEQREPDDHPAAKRVEAVMTPTLQGVKTHRGVVNRMQPPQDGGRMAEAMVAVLERITQDDDEDDLQPHRAGRRPETEEICETEGGDSAGQHYQKEDTCGIDGQRCIRQCVADVSPDLAIIARRPIGAVRKNLLDREEHDYQHKGGGCNGLRKQVRRKHCGGNSRC